MLKYFVSPAKADLLPTNGGSSTHSDPLVTGKFQAEDKLRAYLLYNTKKKCSQSKLYIEPV